MEYTVAIRTLGKAGDKYQKTLDSLMKQSIPPKAIHVYIAEGYDIPKETVNFEKYIYVKKGMVAQRALRYDDVKTEYILFLDDDLFFPSHFVENLFSKLIEHKADVIAPDIYDNASRKLKSEILMTLSGRMRARRRDKKWAYKIMRTCGYSYNKYPESGKAYFSQTNAGACFLCRKSDFLKIHLEDELWLDQMSYSIGDDQVMFYKMYLYGLKQFTLFGTGIEHLDAGENLRNKTFERKLLENDYFFRAIFWHRFIQSPENNLIRKFWNKCSILYFFSFGCLVSILKGQKDILKLKIDSLRKAKKFIKSVEYNNLPQLYKMEQTSNFMQKI